MTKKGLFDPVMPKNRPQSIIWFERLFLIAAFLTAFGILMTLPDYVYYYSASTKAQMTSVYISWGLFCVGWSTLLLSWYYAARRAKIWAKWVFVVACFGALLIFIAAIEYAAGIGLIGTSVLNFLIVLSAGCLFLPSARNWFASGGLVTKSEIDDLKGTVE